jgi:hypothetical protein
MGCVDKALNAVFIGDPGIGRKSLRLRGERFAIDVIMLQQRTLESEGVRIPSSAAGKNDGLGDGTIRAGLRIHEQCHRSNRARMGTMKNSAMVVCLLLANLGIAPLHAQQPQNAARVQRLDGSTISAAEIDATVNRLIAAAKVPGLGLAILNDRKIVYLKAYGLRNTEKKLPMTPETVMTAASLTKST